MYLSFSLVAAAIVIVAVVTGTALSVTASRSLYLVDRSLSPRDFYGAIGVWSLASIWLGTLSVRSYMPKAMSELISFTKDSKLSLKQVVFILVCGGAGIWLISLISLKFTNA